MRDALSVIKNDFLKVRRSVMASCLLLFLILIPLLFTWFNVLATWDPFGNTKDLKIAVASDDAGYTSDFFPIEVNAGEQVLSQLRANQQMDWVITDTDDALEGTRSGEYYASIILPESFSTDLLTFYANGSEPAEIALHTNEKKNALAPTIADKGAQGLSTSISETFTRTVGDVSLGLVSSLSDFLDQDDTQDALNRIEARTEGLQSQLRNGARTARTMGELAESTIPLVESAQRIIDAPLPELPEIADSGAADITASSDALDAALSATRESYAVVGDRIDDLYDSVSVSRETRSATLGTLADNVQLNIDAYKGLKETINADIRPGLPAEAARLTGQLDEAIAAQESVRDRLRAAADSDSPERPDFSSLDQAANAIEDVRNSGIRDQISELGQTLRGIGDTIDLPEGNIQLNTDSLSGASDALDGVAATLDENANSLNDLRNRLTTAGETGDLSELASIVGDDPDAFAQVLAAPVEVDRQAVYPVASFGAGMAPLYTTLALWVGGILASVALRTDVAARLITHRPRAHSDDDNFDDFDDADDTADAEEASESTAVAEDNDAEEIGPLAKYFGRYGTFALIGLAQSTLLTLGLIFFVKVEPAHPFLLVLAGWVASCIFMLLIYALTVALGNTGKALAVFLLVIQISSAGGSYPLQLLPGWFQSISPWLPATYAIDAFRGAIAGIYEADYWIALGTLLLFIMPALILGVVLRKPLAKYTSSLNEALAKTKMM
ncbi:YhgE/Pip domain-containing protein [Corynebacterium ammoniagenes]|uniref:Phage infection protein n=2 Tax=Corynebacterium ammoniagenes TaxID=1697 RepID=A0AAV5G9U7_CORAM|nr:YhgE/Pip domain-containing protein [Corynebacterium ammoniagenes]APT83692.1 phage infection protein [Corynebacterium ammoniagenes DSM 20306]AQS72490.1 phage infection protein [Corynebacterium ammoniagenes]EFG81696.1 YhgE/Pip domain protein [Corynebacterium ammoniagenes DSM 20306]GJN43384.1 phage infection protein [Corynebacterium ammoniagenes]